VEKKRFVGCCANCGWQTISSDRHTLHLLRESWQVIFGLNRFDNDDLDLESLLMDTKRVTYELMQENCTLE